MSRPIDTTADARQRQVDAYRAMTPDDRLRLADQMSAEVRTLARSGIRARHAGDISDDEVDDELARILLGAEVVEAMTARGPAGRR